MSYSCHFCEKESETAHTITVYKKNGEEDRLEVLCNSCYSDWLLSLKG
jgi:hypothetical protein